jgi:chromate transporter
VLVLGKRTLTDTPTIVLALATAVLLLRFKKLQEPLVILGAAIIGIVLKIYL